MDESVDSQVKYECISKFSLAKSIPYIPRRPNSCEKPRNKRAVLSIAQSLFVEIPIINFSQVIRPASSKILNKLSNINSCSINSIKKATSSSFITKKQLNPVFSKHQLSRKKFTLLRKPTKITQNTTTSSNCQIHSKNLQVLLSKLRKK